MVNYTAPWLGSKPDGGVGENCARLVDGNRWGDRYCDFPNYVCMCSSKPRMYLKLRGLCPKTAIDVFYKPLNNWTNMKLTLQGLGRSSITYDTNKKVWKLEVAYSNLNVTSTAPHSSFTLGKHNWTIAGDEDCLISGNEQVKELKMSGCQDGEFTCNSGQCVSMSKRCNQLPDCRDKSDEKNCDVLVLEEGYNMKVPPVESNDPIDVALSIDILKLVDINEPDYSIEIQFEIMLKWKENRAKYNNLKRTDALNALTQDNIEKLWLPEVGVGSKSNFR